MSTSHRFPRGLMAAFTALALGLTSVGAQAQPQRDQRHDQRHDQRGGPRHQAGPGNGPGPQAHRPPMARPPAYRPQPPRFSHDGRGAGPDRNWYRGGRLPPMYRSPHYVVNDWRVHHLTPPPRGYQWVQYGTDYLLIAIATGVIAQLILAN